MQCPECGGEMIRRKSKYKDSYWWGCSNYPNCDVTSTEHPDGTPADYPAGKEIKKLRRRAHELMEAVFGSWYDKRAKSDMYSWIKTQTKSGHIGHATEEELVKVIRLLERANRKLTT